MHLSHSVWAAAFISGFAFADSLSTLVPCIHEGTKTSVLVTRTDQPVLISKACTTATEIVPKVTTVNGKTTTVDYARVQYYCKEWSAPYRNLGPLAIPGYIGSGLCDECFRSDGSKFQPLNFTLCQSCIGQDDSGCFSGPETWAAGPTTTYSCPAVATCTSKAVVDAAGTYTYTFTEWAPATTITVPAKTTTVVVAKEKQTTVIAAKEITFPGKQWFPVVTKTCAGPTIFDFTVAVTKTIVFEATLAPGRQLGDYPDQWVRWVDKSRPEELHLWDDWAPGYTTHTAAPTSVYRVNGWNDWVPQPTIGMSSSMSLSSSASSSTTVLSTAPTVTTIVTTSSSSILTLTSTIPPSSTTSTSALATTAVVAPLPNAFSIQVSTAGGAKLRKRADVGFLGFTNGIAFARSGSASTTFSFSNGALRTSINGFLYQVSVQDLTSPNVQIALVPLGNLNVFSVDVNGLLTLQGTTGFCLQNDLRVTAVGQGDTSCPNPVLLRPQSAAGSQGVSSSTSTTSTGSSSISSGSSGSSTSSSSINSISSISSSTSSSSTTAVSSATSTISATSSGQPTTTTISIASISIPVETVTTSLSSLSISGSASLSASTLITSPTSVDDDSSATLSASSTSSSTDTRIRPSRISSSTAVASSSLSTSYTGTVTTTDFPGPTLSCQGTRTYCHFNAIENADPNLSAKVITRGQCTDKVNCACTAKQQCNLNSDCRSYFLDDQEYVLLYDTTDALGPGIMNGMEGSHAGTCTSPTQLAAFNKGCVGDCPRSTSSGTATATATSTAAPGVCTPLRDGGFNDVGAPLSNRNGFSSKSWTFDTSDVSIQQEQSGGQLNYYLSIQASNQGVQSVSQNLPAVSTRQTYVLTFTYRATYSGTGNRACILNLSYNGEPAASVYAQESSAFMSERFQFYPQSNSGVFSIGVRCDDASAAATVGVDNVSLTPTNEQECPA